MLGRKSPLYERRTMQLRAEPLDYLDTARILPGTDPLGLVVYYAMFGVTHMWGTSEKVSADNVLDLVHAAELFEL